MPALRSVAEIPHEPVAWSDRRLRGAWLVLGLAFLLAVSLFPRVIVNFDEYYYAGEAFTLSKLRALPVPGDPLPSPPMDPAQAMKYPLGWPLLLAPARLVSFRSMFVVALLVHLVGCASVSRMLVRRRVPSALVALYAFHPVLWLYSRTLMSDVPVAALTVMAMDFWEEERPGVAGAVLALTTALRIAAVTSAAGILVAAAIGFPKLRRRAFHFVMTFVIAATLFLLAQIALTGTSRGSGYAEAISMLLTGHMFGENLALYLAGLAMLPPFVLVVAFARWRRVDRWAIAALPSLLFFSFYSFHDLGRSFVETLVGGQRFMAPAIGSLLVSTSRVWGSWFERWQAWAVVASALVAGTISFGMGRLERPYVGALEYVASCKPERVGYSTNAARVAGSVDARSFFEQDGEGPGEFDVYVFSNRPRTHRPDTASWVLSPPPSVVARAIRAARVDDYVIYDLSGKCPVQP